MDLENILDRICPLPEASKDSIRQIASEVKHPAGHLLLRAGKVEPVMYFIKKGIARAFSVHDQKEITFWFGSEGDPVISMKSYVDGGKGYENVCLLENAELYQLKTKELQSLFNTNVHIANWGRRFAESELIKTEERFISRQFNSASERYALLMKDQPDLLQRVQLGYIASYLGITQVSLSRIRAAHK
ncbi:MAG: Crp/Fnr family transcriptional regulator [Flavitalea sp.]